MASIATDVTMLQPVEQELVPGFGNDWNTSTFDDSLRGNVPPLIPATIPNTEGPSEPMVRAQAMPEGWANLPPEVLRLLNPSTDPFASLQPAGTSGPVFTTPTVPTGDWLAPGIPGLAPVPSAPTPARTPEVVLSSVVGALPPAEWQLGVYEAGEVRFERIANRQPGGVRIGTMPMVVFQEDAIKESWG